MKLSCENHCRKGLAAASLLAGVLSATLATITGEAAAARGDKTFENAWACSTLYSRAPIKVVNSDDRTSATCLGEGQKGRAPMTRAEAWELCREQFDTTAQFITWTSKGWHCRYHPR